MMPTEDQASSLLAQILPDMRERYAGGSSRYARGVGLSLVGGSSSSRRITGVYSATGVKTMEIGCLCWQISPSMRRWFQQRDY